MSKSAMQKLIAAICVVVVIVVALIVFLATRNKPEPQTLEETTTVAETTAPVSETPEETTETSYDYTMHIDLNKVKEYHDQNPDVVGWIYIDGTTVDYPIVKGETNDDYFHSDWMKEYSYSGSIFEDYRCDIAANPNTLIYGHNMAAGTMFADLKKYQDETWGKDHLFVEVATLDTRYLCEVFSENVLNGNEGADFQYWNYIQMEEEDFNNFFTNIKDTSGVWYENDGVNNIPVYGDKVVTLQTCETGDNDGIRCVVFAKILGAY